VTYQYIRKWFKGEIYKMRKALYMFIVLLILFACSKQQPGEIYFPKASNGTQWEYLLKYTTPGGVYKGRMIIRINGEETINGKTYYKQVTLTSGIPGEKPHISFNRRTKEGIYKIDENNNARPEYLVTPFPIKVGTTWTARTSDGQTRYQAEKIETVELDNRQYKNCLKMSFQADKKMQHFDGFSYLAPGVGEVYTILNFGEVKVEYALDKYKL